MEAVEYLHKKHTLVYSIEQCEGSTMLGDIETLPVFTSQEAQGAAIVFGNEVKGVSQNVVDSCDGCLEIPQFGTKHSLNVSTAAGIVMWEMRNRLNSNIDMNQ